METQTKTEPVGAEQAGMRLDAFVAEKAGVSRSAAQGWIEQELVLVDGKPAAKNRRLREGEAVSVTVPEPVEYAAQPENIPLDIVYEDRDLLVVNKPQGMVVHPAAGHYEGTLVNALLAHCAGELSGINGVLRPGIVHRIDKDTSGLLIVAKNDIAHRGLAEQIKVHSFTRVYEAVAMGSFADVCGTVHTQLGRHPTHRKKMAILPAGGKEAITHYRVLETFPGNGRRGAYTHLRLQLETGRTHQIRVHMAGLGHPLAGDPLYGPARMPWECGALAGQCLHAKEIEFIHPVTGEKLYFDSPLPDYFTGFLHRLEKDR